MVNFMVKLAEQKPDLVQLLNITNSFEGRRIYGVRVGLFENCIFIKNFDI